MIAVADPAETQRVLGQLEHAALLFGVLARCGVLSNANVAGMAELFDKLGDIGCEAAERLPKGQQINVGRARSVVIEAYEDLLLTVEKMANACLARDALFQRFRSLEGAAIGRLAEAVHARKQRKLVRERQFIAEAANIMGEIQAIPLPEPLPVIDLAALRLALAVMKGEA